MEKSLRDEMVAEARVNGGEHGKLAELDFGAGAEWMYEKLTSKAKVEQRADNISRDAIDFSCCNDCTATTGCSIRDAIATFQKNCMQS